MRPLTVGQPLKAHAAVNRSGYRPAMHFRLTIRPPDCCFRIAAGLQALREARAIRRETRAIIARSRKALGRPVYPRDQFRS